MKAWVEFKGLIADRLRWWAFRLDPHGDATSKSITRWDNSQRDDFDTVDVMRAGKVISTKDSWPADQDRPHYPRGN